MYNKKRKYGFDVFGGDDAQRELSAPYTQRLFLINFVKWLFCFRDFQYEPNELRNLLTHSTLCASPGYSGSIYIHILVDLCSRYVGTEMKKHLFRLEQQKTATNLKERVDLKVDDRKKTPFIISEMKLFPECVSLSLSSIWSGWVRENGVRTKSVTS